MCVSTVIHYTLQHTALESLWDGSASVSDVTSSLTNTLPQLQSSDKKMYTFLLTHFLFPSPLSLPTPQSGTIQTSVSYGLLSRGGGGGGEGEK